MKAIRTPAPLKKSNQVGKTHDYTKNTRGWGHDYAVIGIINKGKKIVMSGWGKGISKGDFLLLDNGMISTRYRVLTVFYYSDPADMWSIKAQFAPRMEGGK
jgi:hypothetical protein